MIERKMTEQEIIDYMMLERSPCYQRHDALMPDSCGHYNCQYHGLCSYTELAYIFGGHSKIEEYIETHPHTNSREDFCFGCGHRCKSKKYKGHHTRSWLGQGKMQHEEQCICRGFLIEPGKWYNCHDENAYESQHQGLQPVWESALGVQSQNGLEESAVCPVRERPDCHTGERSVHRSEVSKSLSTG